MYIVSIVCIDESHKWSYHNKHRHMLLRIITVESWLIKNQESKWLAPQCHMTVVQIHSLDYGMYDKCVATGLQYLKHFSIIEEY